MSKIKRIGLFKLSYGETVISRYALEDMMTVQEGESVDAAVFTLEEPRSLVQVQDAQGRLGQKWLPWMGPNPQLLLMHVAAFSKQEDIPEALLNEYAHQISGIQIASAGDLPKQPR